MILTCTKKVLVEIEETFMPRICLGGKIDMRRHREEDPKDDL